MMIWWWYMMIYDDDIWWWYMIIGYRAPGRYIGIIGHDTVAAWPGKTSLPLSLAEMRKIRHTKILVNGPWSEKVLFWSCLRTRIFANLVYGPDACFFGRRPCILTRIFINLVNVPWREQFGTTQLLILVQNTTFPRPSQDLLFLDHYFLHFLRTPIFPSKKTDPFCVWTQNTAIPRRTRKKHKKMSFCSAALLFRVLSRQSLEYSFYATLRPHRFFTFFRAWSRLFYHYFTHARSVQKNSFLGIIVPVTRILNTWRRIRAFFPHFFAPDAGVPPISLYSQKKQKTEILKYWPCSTRITRVCHIFFHARAAKSWPGYSDCIIAKK